MDRLQKCENLIARKSSGGINYNKFRSHSLPENNFSGFYAGCLSVFPSVNYCSIKNFVFPNMNHSHAMQTDQANVS